MTSHYIFAFGLCVAAMLLCTAAWCAPTRGQKLLGMLAASSLVALVVADMDSAPELHVPSAAGHFTVALVWVALRVRERHSTLTIAMFGACVALLLVEAILSNGVATQFAGGAIPGFTEVVRSMTDRSEASEATRAVEWILAGALLLTASITTLPMRLPHPFR